MRYQRIVPALRLLAITSAALCGLATPSQGQSLTDRLSIHGFMTQAYGVTSRHQYLGIPSGGTTDYRTAALQFRYDADARNNFVIQLSHERLGHSPLGAFEPQVDLDWIFFEHRFGPTTSVRVGKIRSPLGIYNEIRDVGTLLPLYRPPATMYGEKMYASETVDGVAVAHRVPMDDWALSMEGFFGGWRYLQWDAATMAHVDAGFGGQAWLETPVRDLRVGAGAIRFTAKNIAGVPEDVEDDQMLVMASLDGSFSRFTLRSEYAHVAFGEEAAGYGGTSDLYYGQIAVAISDSWTLVGQAELSDLRLDVAGPRGFSFDGALTRDLAAGVRYAPVPSLVLKLEAHRYRGYGVEDMSLLFWVDEPVRLGYGLFSVSTSF